MNPQRLFLILSILTYLLPPAGGQYGFNIIRTFSETRHQIVFASYSDDGKLIVTAGADSSLIIWNAENRTIYKTLPGLSSRPNSAAFTYDNKYVVAAGRDNLCTLWDISAMPPRNVRTFKGHKGAVKSVDVSPDGKYLASGSEDRAVRVWELQSADPLFELKGHSRDVNIVAFSPDGKTIVSGGEDGLINLWNVSNGSRITSQNAHKGYIADLGFSNDGKLLATCGYDKMIYTWQMPGLTKSGSFEGHKDRVQAIDFSPDGKNLISGGWDRIIILWDTETQKPIVTSDKQKQVVVTVDISPAKPDFITSFYTMEALETWVLSGLNEDQWRLSLASGTGGEIRKTEGGFVSKSVAKEEQETKLPAAKSVSAASMNIQIFSPVPVNGRIVHSKSSVTIVGQVADSAGVSGLMINSKPVNLSEAGVFQYTANLKKGDNKLDITAINRKMRMQELALVVTCTAADAPDELNDESDLSNAGYYALLIGINDYEDPSITDLDNPVKDAENLYNVLLSNYTFEKENIIILRNPSLDQIYTNLEDLGNKLTSNDNLLIFYAGHGYWDPRSGIGYWLPSDASKSSTVKWFRNSLLRDFISSIQARHTLLIADACFSGAIFKTRGLETAEENDLRGMQKLFELKSRKAMTSGILQEVPDESAFLKYLVKRLEENKAKYLTSELLFSSFKLAVVNNSSTVPQFGEIQNVGDEGGDFIFIRKDL